MHACGVISFVVVVESCFVAGDASGDDNVNVKLLGMIIMYIGFG